MRHWRPVLAGVLSALVLVAVWLRPGPPPAEAQGVGIYSRPLCTSLTGAVSSQTFCFEQNTNTLKFWNGASWVAGVASQTGINSVKDFGAVGDGVADDTTAIQNTINAATQTSTNGIVFLPPGTYKISSPLNFTTPVYATGLRLWGAGMYRSTLSSTISNNFALRLDNASSGTNGFGVGGELREFAITNSGAPATSGGIEIRGTWVAQMVQVRIESMTGDGVRITNSIGDADSTSNLSILSSIIRLNTGFGINVNNSSAVNSVAFLNIDGNVVTGNTAGGMQIQALDFNITRNSIAQNGGVGGLYVRFNGIGNNNGNITLNNFETNSEQHIKIDSMLGGFVALNNFYHYDDGKGFGARPQRGVVIGDGTNPVQGVLFQSNLVRSTPANPSIPTTIYIASTNDTNVKILDTQWQSFSGGNATRYSDSGTLTTIMDDGNFIITNGITAPRVQISGTGVTSAGYRIRTNNSLRWDINTPSAATSLNFNDGSADRVIFSASGGIQVGAPTGTDQGIGTINVASATYANGQAAIVASASGPNIVNLRGISQTGTSARNLRGTCTFGAASTCAVAFTTNEPDTSYFVALGPNASVASNVHPYGVTSKAVSGFTITATVSNSNAVDWIVIR